MEPNTAAKVHHGRNIKRLREILGIKQEAIAQLLNITQQSFSEMEKRESIKESTLEKVADALKVPTAAIKNMTEEAVMNYINTFNDKVEIENGSFGTNNHCNYSFNPIDKIVELYERMLKEKEEKLALTEKLLGKNE